MDRKYNFLNESVAEIPKIKSRLNDDFFISLSNKGTFKRASKDVLNINSADISFQNDRFSVKCDDFTVSFSKEIEDFECSCKSVTVCRHMISALILIMESGISADTADEVSEPPTENTPSHETLPQTPQNSDDDFIIDTEYLNDVMQFIECITKKGIVNSTPDDCETASRLSLKSENTSLNNISLMLRSLSMTLQSCISKSAGFSQEGAFHLTAKIYNTARAILKNLSEPSKLRILCKKSDRSYQPREMMEFVGLGAYPWSSSSGYSGVTALLFSEDENSLYTYSASISHIHEKTSKAETLKSLTNMYLSRSNWQNLTSIKTISSSRFKLKNAKTNSLSRISTSKSTSMIMSDFTSAMDIMKLKLAPSDDKSLKSDYFSERPSEMVCLITAYYFDYMDFDKSRQILSFAINDGLKSYACELPWNEQNQKAIEFLEVFAEKKNQSDNTSVMFICRQLSDMYMPISIIEDDHIRNFFFE